jgi:hypothetical protein
MYSLDSGGVVPIMSMTPGEVLPKIKSLSYLFTQDGGITVAHCLNLDLVATGKDRDVAEQRLDALVRAQIRTIATRFTFTDLNFSAPQEYWDRFYEGQEFKKVQLELEVPPIILDIEQKMYVPVFMRAIANAA